MDKVAAPTLEEIANTARRSYTTVEDMVCSVLREAIISGVFQPNERLRQDHIAETLGVSRMPVRACLRHLQSEGLVEFHSYRGATVRALSPKEVAEIYELRIVLETFALQGAIEQITDDEVAELDALATKVDAETDPVRWLEIRQTFYYSLYEIADRPKLSELIAKLRVEVGRYWLMLRVIDDPRGHQELVGLISQRDTKAATTWLKQHLSAVSEELQKLVHEMQLKSENT